MICEFIIRPNVSLGGRFGKSFFISINNDSNNNDSNNNDSINSNDDSNNLLLIVLGKCRILILILIL